MELFHTQLTVLLCLLLGNILFGSLPLLLVKVIGHFGCSEEAWCRRAKWSTFLLYVGAGVFISDSFLVLLPQANHEFTKTETHHHNETGSFYINNSTKHEGGHHQEGFPVPELAVLCAFFLAYVLQEVVYFLCSRFNRMSGETGDTRVRFCSCAKRHTECSRTFKDARPDQTLFGLQKKLVESGSAPIPTEAATNVPLEADAKAELLRSSILAQAVPNYGTVTNVTEPAIIDNPLPVLTTPVLLTEARRLAMAHQAEVNFRKKFMISSLLIVMGLALQFIFLGLHLGLHRDRFQSWRYLLIVCLQNYILTFSAGSYFAVGNVEFSCTGLFIALLSTLSPTGLITAMVKNNAIEQVPHLITGIVLAVSCGTLLYTTFCEILRQKKFVGVVGGTKFSAIALGAGIMAVLQYVALTL